MNEQTFYGKEELNVMTIVSIHNFCYLKYQMILDLYTHIYNTVKTSIKKEKFLPLVRKALVENPIKKREIF